MSDDPDRQSAEEMARTISDALTQQLRNQPLPEIVPDPNPADRRWGSIIGPCYTTSSLSRLLRLTPAGIDAAVTDLRLIRLTTRDQVAVFPAFQIIGQTAVPGLRDVLLALRSGIDDPWTWAAWMTARNPLGPASELTTSHIDRLRSGDVERVLRDAVHTAAAWSAQQHRSPA